MVFSVNDHNSQLPGGWQVQVGTIIACRGIRGIRGILGIRHLIQHGGRLGEDVARLQGHGFGCLVSALGVIGYG